MPSTTAWDGNPPWAGEIAIHSLLLLLLLDPAHAYASHALSYGLLTLLSPPRRSWNCWGLDVSDAKMRGVVDAMTSRTRLVEGENTSLRDLGYISAGLDDGWQVRFTTIHQLDCALFLE